VRFFLPRGARDPTVTVPRGDSRERFLEGNEELGIVPGYRTPERSPAAAVEIYERRVNTPNLLLGLLVLAAGASILLGLSRRAEQPRLRETFLLIGSALAMLLSSVALSTGPSAISCPRSHSSQ
jgi:hypothetical protein